MNHAMDILDEYSLGKSSDGSPEVQTWPSFNWFTSSESAKKMEHKQSSSVGLLCDKLSTLADKYPWYVSNVPGNTDHFIYTQHDADHPVGCELFGKRIRGYNHGWIILSDVSQNVMWCLLNPVTSKIICLPPLRLKGVDPYSVQNCCLSAPPEDPRSILMFTRTSNQTFVFCRVRSKKKPSWIETSYVKKLQKILGNGYDFIEKLTCCNGNVFCLSKSAFACFIITISLAISKGGEVMINLSLFGAFPRPTLLHCEEVWHFIKGCGTELFCILVGFREGWVDRAHVMKIDMSRVGAEVLERFEGRDMSCTTWEDVGEFEDVYTSIESWEALADLKDATFFVDPRGDEAAYYRRGIASELGGYIHIRDKLKNILYSYHLKDNTISLSNMPSVVVSRSQVSLWECSSSRFDDDHVGDACMEKSDIGVLTSNTHTEEIGLEHSLLNVPLDVLDFIIEQCVSVDYLNIRATCRTCNAAAPLTLWGKKTSEMRLPTYSVASPWLMVLDKDQGLLTFTDPVSGFDYHMKDTFISEDIYCSMFGWFFFFCADLGCSVLYNPFTCDLRKLPIVADRRPFNAGCLSAPPTSRDCLVAGFSSCDGCSVFLYHLHKDLVWREIQVAAQPLSLQLFAFSGHDLYALDKDGKIMIFQKLANDSYSETIATESCLTSPRRNYLLKRDQDLMKVTVGKLGECVEVFKWDDSNEEWQKVDSLGKHSIYIAASTCLCIEAETRGMGNSIFFPILHSKTKKIMHYSLESKSFQTFAGKEKLKDFFGTTHYALPNVWIEPSWA